MRDTVTGMSPSSEAATIILKDLLKRLEDGTIEVRKIECDNLHTPPVDPITAMMVTPGIKLTIEVGKATPPPNC